MRKGKQVIFSEDQSDIYVNDSQLIVAINGNSNFIIEQLENLIKQCKTSDRKPRQGIFSYGNGVIDIITPKWEGKHYG
jgi:hypothetical protein